MQHIEDIHLSCRCGAVQGLITGASPRASNHLVCLCDDCQAYARFLGGELLDSNGGTEITQVAHRQVAFTRGRERVACVRLNPKGMHRWYAGCCRTPLANTLGAKSLFAGVVHACMRDTVSGAPLAAALGPIYERVQGRYGKGALPADTRRVVSVGFALRSLRHVLRWWLSGAASPSTFFHDGEPMVAPVVLTTEQRLALE